MTHGDLIERESWARLIPTEKEVMLLPGASVVCRDHTQYEGHRLFVMATHSIKELCLNPKVGNVHALSRN